MRNKVVQPASGNVKAEVPNLPLDRKGALMDAAMLNLDVHPEIAARVVAAADQLFAESGKSAIPNVDTVRRKARVDMNQASKVMRAWRKAQSGAAAPVADAIPAQVLEGGQALMQGLWRQASELANTSLAAAQAGWETERAEVEAFRAQLAAAFDEQSNELQTLQTQLRDVLAANDDLQSRVQAAANDRAHLASQAEAMTAEVRHAHARCADLQHHLDDMRSALADAREQAAHFYAEGTRAAQTVATEIARLHAELLRNAERLSTTQAETAGLRSELKTIEKQARSTRPGKDRGAPSDNALPSGLPPPAAPTKRRGNGNASR